MTRVTPVAATVLLLLYGCMTPMQLRQTGNRFEHSSNLPPAKAVACMGRSIEAIRGDWGSRWREGVEAGHYELLVGADEPIFIADASPNQDGGSKISIYSRPGILPKLRDTGVGAMKRC